MMFPSPLDVSHRTNWPKIDVGSVSTPLIIVFRVLSRHSIFQCHVQTVLKFDARDSIIVKICLPLVKLMRLLDEQRFPYVPRRIPEAYPRHGRSTFPWLPD